MVMDAPCSMVRTKSKPKLKQKTFLDKGTLDLKAEYLKCLNKHQLTGTDQDKEKTVKAKKDYDLRLKMLRQQVSAAIWGGTSQGNLQRILCLHKQAMRILNCLGPRVTCRGSFTDLRIMTVVSFYIQEVILLVDGEKLTSSS
ncbi:hypothetical protein J6590_049923 [Homalodisca vitripennis]|nr:hypothetical protein J6590_049923 [Homalodisca vitripennis]